MPTTQSIGATLRSTAAAFCLLVLVASLVMWPRSYVYEDIVAWGAELIPKGPKLTGGGAAASVKQAIIVQSAHGAATLIGPTRGGVLTELSHSKLSWSSSQWPLVQPDSTWLPAIDLTVPRITLPYWLSAAVAGAGLLAYFPRGLRLLAPRRFGVGSLLTLTLAAAVVLTSLRVLEGRLVALAIEAVLFGAVAWKLRSYETDADASARRWLDLAFIVSLSVALGVIAYAVYLCLRMRSLGIELTP